MRLPVRQQRAERVEATEQWLGAFDARREGNELAWVCLPHLIIAVRMRAGTPEPAKPVAGRRAAKLMEREKRQPSRAAALAGDHLVFAFTDNQRRALGPVAELLGPLREAPAPEVDDAFMEGWLQRGMDLAADLIAAADGQPPVRRRWLYWFVVRAARDVAHFQAQVDAVRPRSVVIGSTQSSAARALLLAARRSGIPSVYVPHAPAISEARLADLPVDAAAVRGPLEIDHYAAAGGNRSAMRAVGNPAVAPAGEAPDLSGDSPAFALPVDDPASLELLVELTSAALGERVVASPHPRADRDELRATLPEAWRIWEGRTFDLLREGPPALIQASSGTALEGLQLGIPTIELGFPGERPNYPFLEHPEVAVVSSADELRDAVAAAQAVTPEAREALRDWAAQWVSASGAPAAEAAAGLIEEAADRGPTGSSAWDAWKRPD